MIVICGAAAAITAHSLHPDHRSSVAVAAADSAAVFSVRKPIQMPELCRAFLRKERAHSRTSYSLRTLSTHRGEGD